MDYSSLLVKIRAKLNISQEKLAVRLGVSFATINRWEQEHFVPSKIHRQRIIDLCNELKIKVGDNNGKRVIKRK